MLIVWLNNAVSPGATATVLTVLFEVLFHRVGGLTKMQRRVVLVAPLLLYLVGWKVMFWQTKCPPGKAGKWFPVWSELIEVLRWLAGLPK